MPMIFCLKKLLKTITTTPETLKKAGILAENILCTVFTARGLSILTMTAPSTVTY